MTRMFLDYCMLNDALRDASTLAKLRHLSKEGIELYTGTTVVGEAMEIMAEGPKEGQYMLVDLLRDLKLKFLHPRKEWLRTQNELDRLLEEQGAHFVPASERAHMAMAAASGVGYYITSRPEARTLSGIKGLDSHMKVLDIDGAIDVLRNE